MSKQKARAAVDVGGTFTDLVYFMDGAAGDQQDLITVKADTTAPDFERGALAALDSAAASIDSLELLIHGTTVVINALTERKGVRTALITTDGFRDSLEIARGNRPDFFNLHYAKPPPFVPRHLRSEIGGRMTHTGLERAPLELDGLPVILDRFRAEGVEAIAVCLLHAYANPAHERILTNEIHRLWPDISVVASHEVSREWREYERTNTTVLAAYVRPIAATYLERLSTEIDQRGCKAPIYIMQSNCGVDSIAASKKNPIAMVESGPSSGMWAAAQLGQLIDAPKIIALDIGGTTAKCSLIVDGSIRVVSEYWIERSPTSAGYPLQVPVVDLVEIGNGGGSIAWVDNVGRLHVGPQSAGANPGPAAYGRGGTNPTTTDAHLSLGRIDPDYFCGGQVMADMAAVECALQSIAAPLDQDVREAAKGIIAVANNNMVNALKLVSVNRGYDPRDFTLVAFGGGGGLHASALAAELGMTDVVVPRNADVFSAWGMLMSDLRRDAFITSLMKFNGDSAPAINALLKEQDNLMVRRFEADGGSSVRELTLTRYARLRYENQEHSVEVLLPDTPLDGNAIQATINLFQATYEREYTYSLDAPIEFVGVHTVAIMSVGTLHQRKLRHTGRSISSATIGSRAVDYGASDLLETQVVDGELLEPSMTFGGPAVVEHKGMTVVVNPDDQVRIDDYGNIRISLRN